MPDLVPATRINSIDTNGGVEKGKDSVARKKSELPRASSLDVSKAMFGAVLKFPFMPKRTRVKALALQLVFFLSMFSNAIRNARFRPAALESFRI